MPAEDILWRKKYRDYGRTQRRRKKKKRRGAFRTLAQNRPLRVAIDQGMDPRAVLNLPRTFTVEQLRHHYKALARQLHPDKRQISEKQATEMFQVLTSAYRELLEELELEGGRSAPDRTFDELRGDQSGRAAPEPRRRPDLPIGEGQGFDAGRFNRVFDETRRPDPVTDGGYGRWMQETQPEQAARLNRERQQQQQQQLQQRQVHRQLAVYKEPEPLQLSNRHSVAFSELGCTSVDDYSRSGESARHGIQFTDYRLAHSTDRLADEADFEAAAARASRELRSLKALQAHRANLSYEMTDEETRAYEAAQRELDDRERRRRRALAAYDRSL